MIIDRTDCDIGLPSLKLEGYAPSPLLHMKLQSELITRLADRFGLPKNVTSPADVQEYQRIMAAWMRSFPPTFNLDDPDETADAQRPWIVLHRHSLRATSYSMLLDPIRAYLAKYMSAGSPPDELAIRSAGIDCSLKLMRALYAFFDDVYPRDAKFHLVLFCIFDTAAVLCSALMHDGDGSMPRRAEVLGAIDGAVAMLKRLHTVTRTAKTSYDVLVRVAQRATRMAPAAPDAGFRTARRELTPPASADFPPVAAYASAPGPGPYPAALAPVTSAAPPWARIDALDAVPPPAYAVHTPVSVAQDGGYPPVFETTPPDLFPTVEFGNITQQDLGDLASLWNYESLNLNFINPIND